MRDDRMVIRADAKAIGAVTALSTRVSDRWKSSERSARLAGNDDLSDGTCFSIFPDGSRIPFTRPTAAPTPHRDSPRQRQLSKRDIINNLILSLPATNEGNPDA